MSFETKPEFFTADNGYYTDKAVEYCFKHDIKIIIPDRTEAERRSDRPKKKYAKGKFIENRVENYFICPEGEKLFFKNYRKINGRLHKIYSTTKCKPVSYTHLDVYKRQPLYHKRQKNIPIAS